MSHLALRITAAAYLFKGVKISSIRKVYSIGGAYHVVYRTCRGCFEDIICWQFLKTGCRF